MILDKPFTVCIAALLWCSLHACKRRHNTFIDKPRGKFTVALLPYDHFSPAHIAYIKKETEAFYHCNVVVLASSGLPGNAYYVARKRYKADSLLSFEHRFLTGDFDAVAGLTARDISTSKDTIPDWGVFGLGECPGKVCVISTCRLEKVSNSITQLRERLIKVVLHELGHNLGLPHCTADPVCLMNDAGGSIGQVDREKKWLCGNCRLRLGR